MRELKQTFQVQLLPYHCKNFPVVEQSTLSIQSGGDMNQFLEYHGECTLWDWDVEGFIISSVRTKTLMKVQRWCQYGTHIECASDDSGPLRIMRLQFEILDT